MRLILLPLLLLACLPRAYAQWPAATLDEAVSKARANIRIYRESIPDFSCDEFIDSQRLEGTIVKDEMKVESAFRMTRGSNHEMQESRTGKLLNGKPSTARRVSLPYSFTGGFVDVLQSLGSACIDFRFGVLGAGEPNGNIVVFGASKPASTTESKCSGEKRESKILIDPVSFQILQLDMTYHDLHLKPNLMARLFAAMPSDHNVVKTTITYAPTTLGDRTFWLPTAIENTLSDTTKPTSFRYRASYSNYHRYTATSTIVPTVSQ